MRLLGTVTDGDIRRALLGGITVDTTVDRIMNKVPRTAKADEPWEDVCARFATVLLSQVPIIDDNQVLIDLKQIDASETVPRRDNWVVLMAGGEGRRLQPLTNATPKPMIKVGGHPIIETIFRAFKRNGFHRFYVSVNYKADVLREYLGDGSELGIELRYLEEKKPLGTAGALSLIQETPTEPLIVMNADLLTKLNFTDLLEFHCQHNASATMCVREFDLQVPFGVTQLDDANRVTKIEEKPVYTFFVNAGIYVLDPDLLGHLQKDQAIDMPDFLEGVIGKSENVVAFPIHEYWLDVGSLDSLELAKAQFADVFGSSN
jgi:NDP-sugar pyrophosphorylase family protein